MSNIKLHNTFFKFFSYFNRRTCFLLNKLTSTRRNNLVISCFVDAIDEKHISGWVWDPKNPDKSLNLEVRVDNNLLATCIADNFRPDLKSAGIGNGSHAFDYVFSYSIRNNRIHKVGLIYKDRIIYSSYVFLSINNFLRNLLSKKYIKGHGIEIGALHNPLWVSSKAKVKYVDHVDKETLLKTYHGIGTLTDIDIIDDGETLMAIANNSLDFIICNHMLEHCQNPIGTIRSHLGKIKAGGILYYAIPNKEYTFDEKRKLTPLDHLINDDQNNAECGKKDHLTEWVSYVERITDKNELNERVNFLEKINYSIHFHVWNTFTLKEFILYNQHSLKGIFRIKEFISNDSEILVIIEKTKI